MSIDDTTLELHPKWRQAIVVLRADGKTYGDLLSFNWLWATFGIEEPLADTPYEIAQKRKLDFLALFDDFSDCLLKEYQMALENVRGKGYRIVPAREQTAWAEAEFSTELRKLLRKTGDRMTNVDYSLLTARERQENADTLARLSKFRLLQKQVTRRVISIDDQA